MTSNIHMGRAVVFQIVDEAMVRLQVLRRWWCVSRGYRIAYAGWMTNVTMAEGWSWAWSRFEGTMRFSASI